MKKLLIKIIIFTIILFTFTGCYSLSKMYLYRGVPTTNTSNIMDYIYICILYPQIKMIEILQLVIYF